MRSLLLASLFSSFAVSAFAQAHDLPSPDSRAVPANHPTPTSAKTPVQIEADRVAAYQRVLSLNIPAAAPEATTATATSAPSAQTPLAPSGLQPLSVYSARATGGMHTVVKKDTLYDISKRYGVTVAAIKQANQLPNSRIQLGQNLVIPVQKQAAQETSSTLVTVTEPIAPAPKDATRLAADTGQDQLKAYAVTSGDTLAAISRRTCVSQQQLVSDNSLTDPNKLRPGQMLALPSDHCLAK